MSYELVEHISKSPFFFKAYEKKEPRVFTVESLEDIKNHELVKEKIKDKSWYLLTAHLYKKDDVERFYIIAVYRRKNHPDEFVDSKVYVAWDVIGSVACSHEKVTEVFPIFTLEDYGDLIKTVSHIELTSDEINRKGPDIGHVNAFFEP